MIFYTIVASAAFVAGNPEMKKVFCVFNWHSWILKRGGHRKCKWCDKTQSRFRVGNDEGWH